MFHPCGSFSQSHALTDTLVNSPLRYLQAGRSSKGCFQKQVLGEW